MIVLKKGMFFQYKHCICKITNIEKPLHKFDVYPTKVTLRKYSKGKTKCGYSWQSKINYKNLINKIKEGKYKNINFEQILKYVYDGEIKNNIKK